MLVEKQFETIDACRFCFMCRHVCTVGMASGWESDTPRGKALLLFKVLRGHAEYNDDLVRTIYRCCLCGMCQSWCKGDYTLPEAVLLARGDIVSQGKEPEAARQIKQHLLQTGNPFGLPAGERFQSLEYTGKPGTQEPQQTAEVLYYVGCDTAYQRPEIANAFIRILSHSGVNFTLLSDETSTGKPLTTLGYRDEAKQVAETLAAKIKATGCRVLVTTCPSSFDALKNDYLAMGVDLGGIEVLHASQYLERLVTEGKLAPQNRNERTVTVHDSDRLGRFNAIYDAPRHMLQAVPGVELTEMSWTRDTAHSCGETAGVLRLLDPELSRTLAERLLAEANSTGAQVLATSCPVTKQTLVEANGADIEIRDVVELVAESLA